MKKKKKIMDVLRKNKKMEMLDKKKVVLGLSGGVDSTIAALLLKEKGFDVTGLFFDIEGNSKEGYEAAKKVAQEADIEFVYKNVCKRFRENVVNNFCEEYIQGRTPNPCIVCNPSVKFHTLIDYANEIGANYVATGHYADIHYSKENDTYFLKRCNNIKKDQTYMMYRLPQQVLSRLLLPLSTFETKEETRDIAYRKGMSNALKKDSQEICFISPDESYTDFLKAYGYETVKEGDFLNQEGLVIGKHSGIANFTIGQRKGLGMAFGKPMFVIDIKKDKNQVILGDNDDLFKKEIYSKNNFFPKTGNSILPEEYNNLRVKAKVRYAAKPADAIIEKIDNDTLKIVFEEAQRAPTPGQSIVLYNDDIVIGGGFIEKSE